MQKSNKTITIYELPRDFFVETHRDADATRFYLYLKSMGVKELMFSIPACNEDMEEELILNNAGKHIVRYAEEYCDYDLFEDLQAEFGDYDDEDEYEEDYEDDSDDDSDDE